MILLVTGGSKSGKSTIAESVFDNSNPGERFYIATMQPYGKDADMIIARHKMARQGKGFITLEQYTDIEKAPVSKGSDVLLECVGNLVANEMFISNIKNPSSKIISGIKSLSDICENLVIVTNEVGSDSDYSGDTSVYIKEMGIVNRSIAEIADVVCEMVFSVPIFLKGKL